MPFTAQEIENIGNAILDFHVRGKVESQVLQDRPLFNDMESMKKSFPGGNEFITERVKGVYTTSMTGYSHDDAQAYANPANIRQTRARWYEIAGGIKVTYTELKKAGISVTGASESKMSTHSGSEMQNLTNIFEDKIEDLNEGSRRSFAEMLWRDGSQDAKAIPGLTSIIVETPTVGTTFGISRSADTWWRNRATLAIDSSVASNNNVINTLQKEMRQLRRYATPKHKMYAGSDFMDAMEKEMRAKGTYTDTGWSKASSLDASMADLAFKGISIQYDPLLDDLGKAKYLYVVDCNAIRLRPMADEEWKVHTPARPAEQYAFYQALTYTGALTANRLNTSAVYSIA